MNPSASGWINKFLDQFEKQQLIDQFNDDSSFYYHLKDTGFVYGVSVQTLLNEPVSHLKLTKEEYTKINLFHALLFTFFTECPSRTYEEAVDEMIDFYKTVGKGKRNFLQKLSFTSSKSQNLEKILSSRLQETNTLLKKSSASFLTYSLLYLDILAFRKFLQQREQLLAYAEELEKVLLLCSFMALRSKKEKNKYDLSLIELFESSSEYETDNLSVNSFSHFLPNSSETKLERQYLLDICALAVWDDREIDSEELKFLKELANSLCFSESLLNSCLNHLIDFSEENATSIQMFEYAHPVQQFYKQSSETVKLLILRNKNRLIRELSESGELLLLLSQSTLRELDADEKSKVKDQLLDVCKSIPSLTIFLLPGGAILLPLLVKFIPKLLPSAFAENRIENDKED